MSTRELGWWWKMHGSIFCGTRLSVSNIHVFVASDGTPTLLLMDRVVVGVSKSSLGQSKNFVAIVVATRRHFRIRCGADEDALL